MLTFITFSVGLIALATIGVILVRQGRKWGVALPLVAALLGAGYALAPSSQAKPEPPKIDVDRDHHMAKAVGAVARPYVQHGSKVLVIGRSDEGGAQVTEQWSAALSEGAGTTIHAHLRYAEDVEDLIGVPDFDLVVIDVDGVDAAVSLKDVAGSTPIVLAKFGDKPRLSVAWRIEETRVVGTVFRRGTELVAEPAR